MYWILGVLILLVLIIGIIIWVFYYKFQYIITRIKEAENNIDILFQKKIDYILKAIPIIQATTKEQDFLVDFEEMQKRQKTRFDMNEFLKNSYIEIIKTLDDHEKLLNGKSLSKILDNLEDNEEEIMATIKFYNDNATEFNHLINSFPSNIIRIFLHLKKLNLYSTKYGEIYEILKK